MVFGHDVLLKFSGDLMGGYLLARIMLSRALNGRKKIVNRKASMEKEKRLVD
jgi:hypothetical protein